MKQHKWHKEIKAWADGSKIEYRIKDGNWHDVGNDPPEWNEYSEYRIKPQPFKVLKEMIDGCSNIMQDKEMPKEAKQLAKVFQEDCYRLKGELGYD
jgi:hypothetical protein